MINRRLCFVENDIVFCWIDHFPKKQEISNDEVGFDQMEFEDKVQSTQKEEIQESNQAKGNTMIKHENIYFKYSFRRE